MKQISGRMRFYIFISALWLLAIGIKAIDEYDFILFLQLGIFPLFFIWGIWWVKKGYKKDKEE